MWYTSRSGTPLGGKVVGKNIIDRLISLSELRPSNKAKRLAGVRPGERTVSSALRGLMKTGGAGSQKQLLQTKRQKFLELLT